MENSLKTLFVQSLIILGFVSLTPIVKFHPLNVSSANAQTPQKTIPNFTGGDFLVLDLVEAIGDKDWDKVEEYSQKILSLSKTDRDNLPTLVDSNNLLNIVNALQYVQSLSAGEVRSTINPAKRLLGYQIKARNMESLNSALSVIAVIYSRSNNREKWESFIFDVQSEFDLSTEEKRSISFIGKQIWARATRNVQDFKRLTKEAILLSRQANQKDQELVYTSQLSQIYRSERQYVDALRELETCRSLLTLVRSSPNIIKKDLSDQSMKLSFQSMNIIRDEGDIDRLIGEIYLEQKDYDRAISQFKKSVDSYRRPEEVLKSLYVKLIISQILYQRGNFIEADEYLNNVNSQFTTIDLKNRAEYQVYLNWVSGYRSYLKKDFTSASSLLSESIQFLDNQRQDFSPFISEYLQSADFLGLPYESGNTNQNKISEYLQRIYYENQQSEQALIASELSRSRIFNNFLLLRSNLRPKLAVNSTPAISKKAFSEIFINFPKLIKKMNGVQNKTISASEITMDDLREMQSIAAIMPELQERMKVVAKLKENNFSLKSLMPLNTAPNLEEMKAIAKSHNATLVEYSLLADVTKLPEDKTEKKMLIWVIKPTGEIQTRQVDFSEFKASQAKRGLTFTSIAQLIPSIRESINARSGNQKKQTFSIGDRVRFKGEDPNLEPFEILYVDEKKQLLTVKNPSYSKDQPPENRPFLEVLMTTQNGLQQLHQLLIAPISDLLPTNPADKIIFIPHKELFLVPFPALQDAAGQYLITQHTVSTAPAIQTLALTQQQKQTRSGKSGEPLVVGNPMPNTVGNLPAAEQEAQEVAQLLGTTAILRGEANRNTIIPKLQNARILHFATHGILDEDRGIGSSIVLSGATEDEGHLRAEEILEMKLNAELVVLSACDTGRGKLSGDGVIGLSRSFIAAGVPSVIVSLWKVPDQSTAPLMTQFYQNLKVNPDKAVALREAMLTTMKQYPDPVNWAAFTLIGEP